MQDRENATVEGSNPQVQEDIPRMRVLHGSTPVFDDPNLVSCGGLAPLLALAERARLHRLVGGYVRVDRPGGVNAAVKVPALIAGMTVGADAMGLLRPRPLWPAVAPELAWTDPGEVGGQSNAEA